MATKEQIARAIQHPGWQDFRKSLKGLPTKAKLKKLRAYWTEEHENYKDMPPAQDCDVCICVDNYLKALARGGQLRSGVSIDLAMFSNWELPINK